MLSRLWFYLTCEYSSVIVKTWSWYGTACITCVMLYVLTCNDIASYLAHLEGWQVRQRHFPFSFVHSYVCHMFDLLISISNYMYAYITFHSVAYNFLYQALDLLLLSPWSSLPSLIRASDLHLLNPHQGDHEKYMY